MSDHSELLNMISAVLDAKKAKGKKPAAKAPAEPAEINGIRIVDESTPKPTRAKKMVPVRDPSPPPTPKAASRPRKVSESPPREREYPKPTKALALKRNPTRPMPHSCNCPLCPLKN
jgi:cell division septation protein DedD